MGPDRPFVGTRVDLINQQAAMQVTILVKSAAADDALAAQAACRMLAEFDQLEEARKHLRPEAHGGDVVAMKALVWAAWLVGADEEANWWLRTAARSGDVWAAAQTGPGQFSDGFQKLAAQYAGQVIEQQDRFNEFLGTNHIEFDLDLRTLTADGRVTLTGVTFLGSYSSLGESWLWGWENQSFGWEHPAAVPLRKVYEAGEHLQIPEFTAGYVDLSGHPEPRQAATTLSMIAAALLGISGVSASRNSSGHGVTYLHLDDPQIPVTQFDPARAPEILAHAVDVFPADPRLVAQGYLRHHGLQTDETEDSILTRLDDGRSFAVTFDDEGRIRSAGIAP